MSVGVIDVAELEDLEELASRGLRIWMEPWRTGKGPVLEEVEAEVTGGMAIGHWAVKTGWYVLRVDACRVRTSIGHDLLCDTKHGMLVCPPQSEMDLTLEFELSELGTA